MRALKALDLADKTLRSATDLVVNIRSHPKGLRRLMEPLISAAIHRQVAAHYARLKTVMEQHTELCGPVSD